MTRFAVLLLWLPLVGFAQDHVLKTLRKAHPRLIALDADMDRVKSLIRQNAQARRVYESLRQEASKIDAEPPVVHRLIGPRLLDQSRRALGRVYTLALLYRLDGERRWLARAVKELQAAAEFPDWNPSHFLDTAEMTHAFAIGYDWLYPSLELSERAWMRKAIVEKGLRQALKVYERPRGWHTVTHNWNQVCNGGMGLGALAIAEEEPELAETILKYALHSLPKAMGSYAPDGGWAEGPGYWNYATRYTVYFLAGLETALGTDFGLSKLPGFDRAGHFRIYFSGPAGQTFNYADAGSAVGSAPVMFWLARKFDQPVYAWQQQQILAGRERAEALDLIWYEPKALSPKQAQWPLDAYFAGVQVAFLRSAWEDGEAIFVGVKGGDNKANHSHLDLGTFVLDAGGVRWAEDLGSDNYNLPGYFGDKRWTYYRLCTESHNTLWIDRENQDPKAAAPIVEHVFEPKRAWVRIDLRQAYPGKLSKWERTVTLEDRSRALIEDVFEASRPVEAVWGMVTRAEVTLEGRRARLTLRGRRLEAEIRSPEDAIFEVASTQPPQPQNQNQGTRKLVVRLPNKTASARILVALVPAR